MFWTTANNATTPDPEFVVLDIKSGSLTITPKLGDLQGRAWSVYITGNVRVNDTIQGPLYKSSDPFSLKVLPALIYFENTAPMMANFQSEFQVFANYSRSYTVGVPYDMQLDKFYMQEWGFKGLKSD